MWEGSEAGACVGLGVLLLETGLTVTALFLA